MPPKRVTKAKMVEPEPVATNSVYSDNDSVVEDSKKSVMSSLTKATTKKPVALVKFTNENTKTSSSSDRLQLAQAINNLVFKGDSFTNALEQLHEMTNERLTELDLQLESKQQEYDSLMQKINNEHTTRVESLQQEYQVLEKELTTNYNNNKKDMERNYENKSKELELSQKNLQIETSQKLREFKLKACKDMATENGFLLVEKTDNDKLITEKNTLVAELKQLKDKFDSTLKAEVTVEKNKYDSLLKQEKLTMELTYKMQTAEVNAQVLQLKKEVDVLNKMIDNLKNELAEQRNLTKEVASSASRSAINQTIGNK